MEAWHFLNDEGTLRKGNITVTAGQTLVMRGKIELCARGFHASIKPLDALEYAPGAMIQRVKLGGTIIEDTDKVVASERTCLWIADATTTLHEFAIWCAETALNREVAQEREVDGRSWEALAVKRQWLAGEATDSELAAARAAARAAAWDAAWAAAWDAAWAAAWDAAWAAARAAAGVAAWDAARAAAWDAAWDAASAAASAAQNKHLEQMLLTLAPQEVS